MKKATKFFTATLLVLMCFVTLSVNAQRCAVLEFKAGVGISQADVDGISAIFITYFHPAGYTMVERTQIDKVIEEQGFQRSNMTQSQMVRVGQLLNVSKIVVGDINFVMNQYNVDTRVINVETGTIAATEGATFATSSYRSSMQNVATKLAAKIALTSGSTVNSSPSAPRKRTSVETVYGYLKVFPNELGDFSSEPTSVIAQINMQAQHGYNNWRIPTNEELSLLRANNYLGSGTYMTQESRHGIVLLVTDGKDYATLQTEERMRIKAEQEQEEIRAEQERKSRLKAEGWVDLGLPSGTLWKNRNEEGGFYTYGQAMRNFSSNLPTKNQCEELINSCRWTWNGNGYKIVGPNGESIVLPAKGVRAQWVDYDNNGAGKIGHYWSSTSYDNSHAYGLDINDFQYFVFYHNEKNEGATIRLVRQP